MLYLPLLFILEKGDFFLNVLRLARTQENSFRKGSFCIAERKTLRNTLAVVQFGRSIVSVIFSLISYEVRE